MQPTAEPITFDRFTLDTEARELLCNGHKIRLQEKPFRLLITLLERSDRVVPRQELYDRLWPNGIHVDREAGLNTAVRKLRTALRQAAGSETDLLQTVPRVGYRLHADKPTMAGRPKLLQGTGGRARVRPRFAYALMVLMVASGLFLVMSWRPTAPSDPMPDRPELRALYLEARSLLGTDGDLERARQLLRSLSAQAPDFAPGYAHLAETSARLAMRPASLEEDITEARSAAERAHQLDPRSAVAHRVRGMLALNFDWDPSTAALALERALELAPEDPINHLLQGFHASVLGQHQAALAAVRKSIELAPESMVIRSDAGYFLLRAGQYREAITECEMVLRLTSESTFARRCLLKAYAMGGDTQKARAQAERLLEAAEAPAAIRADLAQAEDPRRAYLAWYLEQLLASPDRSAVQIATVYLALGKGDEALEWLAEAARQRRPTLILVPHDPQFAELRTDPRFRDILSGAGLEI